MAAKYVIRLDSELLHELLQRIAVRAYELGRDDAKAGRTDEKPEVRVHVDPAHLRKFV